MSVEYALFTLRITPIVRVFQVYTWWKLYPRDRYPSTLYVTVKGIIPPAELEPAARSLVATQPVRSTDPQNIHHGIHKYWSKMRKIRKKAFFRYLWTAFRIFLVENSQRSFRVKNSLMTVYKNFSTLVQTIALSRGEYETSKFSALYGRCIKKVLFYG